LTNHEENDLDKPGPEKAGLSHKNLPFTAKVGSFGNFWNRILCASFQTHDFGSTSKLLASKSKTLGSMPSGGLLPVGKRDGGNRLPT